MKKIVSNILVVATQLMIGGLFLVMLFSGSQENNRVLVVDNNNLNKMADSVSQLFEVSAISKLEDYSDADSSLEEELISAEEAKKRAEEEAQRKAEEEARRAQEEAERLAQEEAQRKAEEEAARAARAAAAGNQTVAELQEYAHDLVINSYGWSEEDFNALVNLWYKESNWNVNCYNSYSGAYGIPQSLPGNKMASEGADWETNGQTQIRWGLKYIQGRYGSPSSAWGSFLARCSSGNCWY